MITGSRKLQTTVVSLVMEVVLNKKVFICHFKTKMQQIIPMNGMIK